MSFCLQERERERQEKRSWDTCDWFKRRKQTERGDMNRFVRFALSALKMR